MTDKLIYVLRAAPHAVRQHAHAAINAAPDGYTVTISPPKRSVVQNAKMWCLLSDVSKQVDWYGLKLTAEDWKDVLTASLRKDLRTVPNVDGNGLVVLGMRTSQMSIREMNELIEFMYAFGSTRNVVWSEPDE